MKSKNVYKASSLWEAYEGPATQSGAGRSVIQAALTILDQENTVASH